MAFELHRDRGFPGVAASAIDGRVPVRLAPAGVDRGFIPVAAVSEPAFGVSQAAATQGEGVAVHERGSVVRVTAAAAVGVGDVCGLASPNGSLGPVAGASGSIRHAVGDAVTPAGAAGETFSLYVNPRQLSDGGAI